jgi:hypothetical protein
MQNEQLYLPIASALEFLGVLTLLTHDTALLPKVDIGFTVPAVLPAQIQGVLLFLTGFGLTMYAIFQMSQ